MPHINIANVNYQPLTITRISLGLQSYNKKMTLVTFWQIILSFVMQVYDFQ